MAQLGGRRKKEEDCATNYNLLFEDEAVLPEGVPGGGVSGGLLTTCPS